jgi:hypothetical protein
MMIFGLLPPDREAPARGLGVQLHVAEAALNHLPPKLIRTTMARVLIPAEAINQTPLTPERQQYHK